MASCIHQLLATDTLQNHILRVLQPAYARRYHAIVTAIAEHLLPLGILTLRLNSGIAGGYFVWLKLPEPLRSDLITRKAAEEEDLIISDGNLFRVQDDNKSDISFERNIRICFSYETEANLVQGVVRLARLVHRELQNTFNGTVQYE